MLKQKSIERKGLSRQRRWQLRKAEQGRCITCGKPQDTGKFCAEHWAKHRVGSRELMRKRLGCKRRNLGAASYNQHPGAQQC